ncbi:MAG: DUF2167 domain-containing protein [Acidobacteriales bacterium]|nr:DUF2167 domain-containing protein [Terriglobales bacterium]
MRPRYALCLLCIVFLFSAGLTTAQENGAQSGPRIDWQDGPATGDLRVAEIAIPEGYRFTGVAGAKRFMELTQNPPTGRELGVLIPNTKGENDAFWFVVFEFQEDGYIKDDEKDKLNSATLLNGIREGNESANKVRKERGWNTLEIVGWEKEPFYDQRSHNLTWAIRGRTPGQQDDVVNYSTRVLGRRGTMNVDLVLDPQLVSTVIPEFDNLIGGFTYKQGSRYSEFVQGDKVAKYGLTALVAGGVGAAAVKSGLLGKLWKFIVFGILALVALIKKIFTAIKRMFSTEEAPPQVNYLDQK